MTDDSDDRVRTRNFANYVSSNMALTDYLLSKECLLAITHSVKE